MAYNLRTGLIGTGDIDVNVSLNDLNASNITDGVFATDRIPTLGDAKLSDLNAAKLTGTLSMDRIQSNSIPKAKISESSQWAETEIPTLPKTKIASGANTGKWDVEDIPSLPTSQITSGTQFPLSFIPDIPAGKVLGLSLIPITSSQLSLVASDIPKFSVNHTNGAVTCKQLSTSGGSLTTNDGAK